MPDSLEPVAYRVSDLSALLRVPRSTLYRWIARGDLGAARVGEVLLIPRREIDRLLADNPARPTIRAGR